MGQYDVHRTQDGVLVIDVQSDLVSTGQSRVVVPLLAVEDAPIPMKRLNPRVTFEGRDYIVETQYLASIARGMLGPVVTTMPDLRDELTRALDILFHGL